MEGAGETNAATCADSGVPVGSTVTVAVVVPLAVSDAIDTVPGATLFPGVAMGAKVEAESAADADDEADENTGSPDALNGVPAQITWHESVFMFFGMFWHSRRSLSSTVKPRTVALPWWMISLRRSAACLLTENACT